MVVRIYHGVLNIVNMKFNFRQNALVWQPTESRSLSQTYTVSNFRITLWSSICKDCDFHSTLAKVEKNNLTGISYSSPGCYGRRTRKKVLSTIMAYIKDNQ